jgi:hypothetical protein
MPADGMSAAVKIKKGQSARPTSSSLKRLYVFRYVGNVTRAGVSARFAIQKIAGRVLRATPGEAIEVQYGLDAPV